MSASPLNEPLFLSVPDFCRSARISKATFYRAVKAGEGPLLTKIRGKTLIRVESAREWAERREQVSSDAELKPRGSAKRAPTLTEMLSGRA